MANEWEVAVIGGGPAGLSAALAAAECGARVILLDAYPTPGGQYYWQSAKDCLSKPTRHQRQGFKLWQRVKQANVRIISDAQVWYIDPGKKILFHTNAGNFQVRAQALVLATGAYDRAIPFPGWNLPGVMMTGGAQNLLYQHVLPGKRVLLVGTGPLQLVVAKKLLDAGADVVAVLEGNRLLPSGIRYLPALWGQWERMEEGVTSYATMLRKGVSYRQGWGILEAHGSKEVEGATIARLDRDWRPVLGSEQEVECDTICINYGFLPFNALSRQIEAQQVWNDVLGGIIPKRDENLQTSVEGVYAVGDCAGMGGVRMALIEGRIAGYAAARKAGYPLPKGALNKVQRQKRGEERFQHLLLNLFRIGPGAYELAEVDTLICRCEGTTKKDIMEAIRSGARSTLELKSMTRCGMGECQGRFCEQSVLHLLQQHTQKPIEVNQGYHLRPPAYPLAIGDLGEMAIDVVD